LEVDSGLSPEEIDPEFTTGIGCDVMADNSETEIKSISTSLDGPEVMHTASIPRRYGAIVKVIVKVMICYVAVTCKHHEELIFTKGY
jgi:hypothetical protein